MTGKDIRALDVMEVSDETSDDGTPVVVMNYRDWLHRLSVPNARKLALELFAEATIAEYEAALIGPFFSQGFSRGADQKAVAKLNKLRALRPKPRPQWVNAIFGFKTRLPLVDMELPGQRKLTLGPNEAIRIAEMLIECAEASETDDFLRRFLKAELDLDDHAIQGLILQFRCFREGIYQKMP